MGSSQVSDRVAYFGTERALGNQAVGDVLQTKLKIGQPNDRHEQEADSIADRVVHMSVPAFDNKPTQIQAHPQAQRKCAACEAHEKQDEPLVDNPISDPITPVIQRMPQDEEDDLIQVKTKSGNSSQLTSGIQTRISGLGNQGQPLYKMCVIILNHALDMTLAKCASIPEAKLPK